MKNGQEQWVFVHIEVQGAYERIFPKRMFQYFYRIMDMYDQQIYALALFTDQHSKNNLDKFQYDFFGTKVTYDYNTYRIASQSESTLLQSNNPFSLAILAGLYVLKSKKNNNLKLQYKRKLMRLLLQGKIISKETNRAYIRRLFIFIDHIMRLPEEDEAAFVQELEPLIKKEETSMGLSLEDTSFARYFRKEGLEEGMAKGIEKGKAEGIAVGKAEGEKQKAVEIATRLLQKGFSVDEVSEDTGLAINEVELIKENL